MTFRPGQDPAFPHLSEHDRYPFPPPHTWRDSIIAIGGNLSPGMLLSAYEQGLFPWYGPKDPLLWQSPDPRMVIFPKNLHISRSMRTILKKGVFKITLNGDFDSVIRGCAGVERSRQGRGQGGTWISAEIIDAYTALHRLGWIYSAEAYNNGKLSGGCYGIRIGQVFCGESMFALKPNASKAAFISLAQHLFADGAAFIDCQVPSDHLRSLGGQEINRADFLALLRENRL